MSIVTAVRWHARLAGRRRISAQHDCRHCPRPSARSVREADACLRATAAVVAAGAATQRNRAASPISSKTVRGWGGGAIVMADVPPLPLTPVIPLADSDDDDEEDEEGGESPEEEGAPGRGRGRGTGRGKRLRRGRDGDRDSSGGSRESPPRVRSVALLATAATAQGGVDAEWQPSPPRAGARSKGRAANRRRVTRDSESSSGGGGGLEPVDESGGSSDEAVDRRVLGKAMGRVIRRASARAAGGGKAARSGKRRRLDDDDEEGEGEGEEGEPPPRGGGGGGGRGGRGDEDSLAGDEEGSGSEGEPFSHAAVDALRREREASHAHAVGLGIQRDMGLNPDVPPKLPVSA
jgi:hypothetical protein